MLYCPGKAANAGGVAVSALEMSQNSQRLTWTAEEVDSKLDDIMETFIKLVVIQQQSMANKTILLQEQMLLDLKKLLQCNA